MKVDIGFHRKSRLVEIWPGEFVVYHPRLFGIHFGPISLSLHTNGEWRRGRWATFLVRKT